MSFLLHFADINAFSSMVDLLSLFNFLLKSAGSDFFVQLLIEKCWIRFLCSESAGSDFFVQPLIEKCYQWSCSQILYYDHFLHFEISYMAAIYFIYLWIGILNSILANKRCVAVYNSILNLFCFSIILYTMGLETG